MVFRLIFSLRSRMAWQPRQVVQALVVSTVVVVLDELLDALVELSWQVVVVQQDPVFHRAMSANRSFDHLVDAGSASA